VKEKKKFESFKNYFTERKSDIKKKSKNLLIEDMNLMFTLHKNDNYSVNASAIYEMTPTEKSNKVFVYSEESRSIKNNDQSSNIFRSRFNFGSKFQSSETIHTAVSEEFFKKKDEF